MSQGKELFLKGRKGFVSAVQAGKVALSRKVSAQGFGAGSQHCWEQGSEGLHPWRGWAGMFGCASPPGELGQDRTAAPGFNLCVGTRFWPFSCDFQHSCGKVQPWSPLSIAGQGVGKEKGKGSCWKQLPLSHSFKPGKASSSPPEEA